MPCPLRRLWPYRFRERPPYVLMPLFVRSTVVSNYPLILSRFCIWYMKSLARRASFFEGSARVVKAYKAKVASLTSEKADLRARMQRLADLKHTTTAKVRAEDKEKKAWGELRVTEDELRAVRNELQVARDELRVVRDELRIKATILSQVNQEAFEVVSSVERLTEEFHGLREDL